MIAATPQEWTIAATTFVASATGLLAFVRAGKARARKLGLDSEQWFAARYPWTAWLEPGTAVLVLALAGTGVLFGVLLAATGSGGPVVLACGLGGPVIGLLVAGAREKAWEQRFGERLPDAAVRIADSVRAGIALPQAVERVGGDVPEPVRSVLRLVVQAHNDGGLPFGQALQRARTKVASRDLNLVFEALGVCYEKGGPLPDVLERIARSLRELRRFRAKVLSSTAGARLGIKIMLVTPVAMLLLLRFLEPDAVDLLLTTLLGWIVLAVVAGMVGVAFLWSRSILRQYL